MRIRLNSDNDLAYAVGRTIGGVARGIVQGIADPVGRPFTTQSVARFTGWPEHHRWG